MSKIAKLSGGAPIYGRRAVAPRTGASFLKEPASPASLGVPDGCGHPNRG